MFKDFKDSLTGQKCVEKHQRIFGNQAPSYIIVKRQYSKFFQECASLSDEYRQGRAATAVSDKNIDAVQRMIENEKRKTYDDIEASLGFGSGRCRVKKILHDHLGVPKVCTRWVPHNLTESQKKARVEWSKEMLNNLSRVIRIMLPTS